MTIKVYARPMPGEEWTEVTFSGENEDDIAAVAVLRLLLCDYEVIRPDEDGDLVQCSPEDYRG